VTGRIGDGGTGRHEAACREDADDTGVKVADE
jgi:hypothetical protein